MAYIRIELPNTICDGQTVTFRSPADCSQVTGLKVYYKDGGQEKCRIFQLADAHGDNVGGIDLFASDVLVRVILDTELNRAYVQLGTEGRTGPQGVGVAAVVYDGPPNPREIYVDYYATNLSQGVSYKVTVDVMGRLELLSGGATGKVSISLISRDANNAVVGSPVQGPSVLPDISSWKKLEWTVTIPASATKPVFRVGFYDAIGTVYVDNLTITQTSPSGAVSLIDPSFEAGLVPSQKNGGWTFDSWNINFVSQSGDAASDGKVSAKLQYGLTTQWKTIYTDGTEQPITAPAFPDVSGYMPIHGGAFTGAVSTKNGVTAAAQLRNTALVSSETYPTVNGQINWQYE